MAQTIKAVTANIRKCWLLNASIPKGYGIRSQTYARRYARKDKMIREIIDDIRKHQIPIKYGQNADIVYFAAFGIQYSFHVRFLITTKHYAGRWVGQPLGGTSNRTEKRKRNS
jgi:hypothetical protein